MKLPNFFISILIFVALTYSCSNSNDNQPEAPLENVTHNVLFWEFTSDTGNDTFRLRYEIEFHNPNNVDINGFYKITQNADGLITSLLSTDSSPCYKIQANSTCTFSFDEEDSFETARINSINLISVEYNLEE